MCLVGTESSLTIVVSGTSRGFKDVFLINTDRLQQHICINRVEEKGEALMCLV